MTIAASIAGYTAGITAPSLTSTSSATTSNAPATSISATNTNSNTAAASAQDKAPAPVSPQFTYDPVAGLIIQYLNSSGLVQEQIPSTTVVAYLRAGLTANGLPNPQNTDA